MDFVNCSAKRSSKGCCGRGAATDSELGSCDHIYANLVEGKSKGINTEDFVHVEPMTMACTNKRNEDSRKRRAPRSNTNVFAYQPSPVFIRRKMASEIEEDSREPMEFSDRLPHDADFQCPRCGQRMEEPRLLPCLHSICLSCVYELMSKPPNVSSKNEIRDGRMYAQSDIYETCPLCDSHLPNANSAVPPPPHYPLQHRLVMDTVRRKLVNRVLCDTCTGEVLAFIQCSTCLRNFCSECGRQHEQQNLAEARIIKHLMRPLWEATKVRRTILCQTHPTHALRFYCIACQQVTCKECMWSMQHRGHASEDAVGVGRRAGTYLARMLQKAKMYLNNLLIQYNYDVFSTNDLEEAHHIAKICRSAFRTNSLPGSGSSSANDSLGRSLRNDLLVAADSVTNAMSTLVRELNSDSDQEDHSHNSGLMNIRKPLDFEAGEDGDDSSGGGNSWREELQRRYQQENDFLAELRSRNSIPQTPSATLSNEQEQERGEREEADGEKEDEDEANWAEAVKRWVNR